MPRKHIAPRGLILKDFQHLKEKHQLCTTPDIANLIYIQSIEGHAHGGDSAFKGKKYVNTTIDDIVLALGWNPHTIRAARQEIINNILQFCKRVIEGESPNQLTNSAGEPLVGVDLFLDLKVEPANILRGLYLGGQMDRPTQRREVEQKYNCVIGAGQCYLINTEIMHKLKLNGGILAHGNHERQIEYFHHTGLIVDPRTHKEGGPLKYTYIRHWQGNGISDDAGIVGSGLLFNRDISIALGVFLADAVDTLDKYSSTITPQGQDEMIANYIAENFPPLNISQQQVQKFVYLAAIPEGLKEKVPDSSLRHLLEYDRHTHQPTLASHLSFLKREHFYPMDLASQRIDNRKFYEYMEKRLDEIS